MTLGVLRVSAPHALGASAFFLSRRFLAQARRPSIIIISMSAHARVTHSAHGYVAGGHAQHRRYAWRKGHHYTYGYDPGATVSTAGVDRQPHWVPRPISLFRAMTPLMGHKRQLRHQRVGAWGGYYGQYYVQATVTTQASTVDHAGYGFNDGFVYGHRLQRSWGRFADDVSTMVAITLAPISAISAASAAVVSAALAEAAWWRPGGGGRFPLRRWTSLG